MIQSNRVCNFTLLLFLILVIGCRNKTEENIPASNSAVSNAKSNSTYSTPIFADLNRAEKVRSAIPLVESVIHEFMEQEHLPGVAGGIVLDGKLIHSFYYGYNELSSKTLVDSLSAFRIASMTKSFTAMAILKLRDEGKLRLDDSASKYIPEMKSISYLTSDAPAITVRDLMMHRAGFPEDNPYGDRQLADTDEELMNMVLESPAFSNVSGISYEYSNLGFALLGKIVRNVTGISCQQYITENIFKPLGMTHSYWEFKDVPTTNLARGYRWINNNWRDEALLKDGSWAPMGGLITTIDDFSKYMIFHLSAWPPRNGEDNGPIKRSSVREMQQPWSFSSLDAGYVFPSGKKCPTVTSYGYGLNIVNDCNGRTYIGHGGGLPGFGSHWRIMPEYGIGLVIFSNRTYGPASRLTLPLLDTILAISHLDHYRFSSSSILEQRKNELVKLFPSWENASSSPIFADNFFADYPIESLKAESIGIFSKAGKIITVKEVQATNQLRGYFNIICENALLKVTFTLSPEHDPKIQAYKIEVVPR